LTALGNFHRDRALIDFCCWIAVFFLSVRPELSLNGSLVIKDGRHPLVHEATREPVVSVSDQCKRAAIFLPALSVRCPHSQLDARSSSRLSNPFCAALIQNDCRLQWDRNFRVITGANGVSRTADVERVTEQLNAGQLIAGSPPP